MLVKEKPQSKKKKNQKKRTPPKKKQQKKLYNPSFEITGTIKKNKTKNVF